MANIILAQGTGVTWTTALYQSGLLTHTNGTRYILKNNGLEKTLDISLGVERSSDLIGSATIFDAYVAFIDASGNHLLTTDTMSFHSQDFTGPNGTPTASGLKQVFLKIPASFVMPGRLAVAYRSRASSSQTTGFFVVHEERAIPVVVETQFDGPDNICSEATYTITYPGTITLENATGIASLTALGNNQWKITKTGSINGVVTLKSQQQYDKYTKTVEIGSMLPTSIDGNNILNAGSHSFILNNSSLENTIVWNARSQSNNVSITTFDNGNFIQVNVSNWNPYGNNQIILEVTITSPCGESTTLTRTLGAGYGGPIEET
ncbi:hypothetical protein [Sphingobacterium sp. LRF_L2]|uniref:hypothetical protein n=1 Tax=Sphingobacterium sp. LRF_L2 TaxID=3369421 RepID=UPI003F615E5F